MYNEISANKSRTFLLIFIFLVLVIAVGWALSNILGRPWILPFAIVFSVFQALISYYYSDSIALGIARAHEAPREEYIELHRLMENIAITAGLPKPKIYVIEDNSPNAFATGRDPNHASLAVTTGLLGLLNKTELEGVVAHEMSHIGNYDIRLMTVVVVLVGTVVLISDLFLRWSIWGGRGRSNNREGGQIQMLLAIVAIVLIVLSPIFATLIQLAISRRREYLADASGALLTRFPEGLASALEKLGRDRHPLEAANKAMAHMYIADPMKLDNNGRGGWLANLFNTHPPIRERIKKLREMIPGG
ncbi:MAG: M48 family metalloprotease [bacterium]|nr:M48 family metalloprotease [bacterium]